MAEFVAVFMGALLSSAHCIGMCGGFAVTIGMAPQPTMPVVFRQLLYSMGRVVTYAFLGMLAGGAGQRLSAYKLSLIGVQQGFSILAGVIMVIIGLSILGVLPRKGGRSGGSVLAPLFAYFLNARGAWGFFTAGLANGFLPCGLVYAALGIALASASPWRGAAVMVFFGLGTTPAMMLIGCGSRLLTAAVRLQVLRVAAAVVIVLGGITIYRALPIGKANCCSHAVLPARRFPVPVPPGMMMSEDCRESSGISIPG